MFDINERINHNQILRTFSIFISYFDLKILNFYEKRAKIFHLVSIIFENIYKLMN
jgi:hypothetical protein